MVELNKVITVQTGAELNAESVGTSPMIELEKPTKTIKLRALLEERGIFTKLETTPENFFSMFAILVNAASVQTLDVSVDESAQVVVLPRIVGG